MNAYQRFKILIIVILVILFFWIIIYYFKHPNDNPIDFSSFFRQEDQEFNEQEDQEIEEQEQLEEEQKKEAPKTHGSHAEKLACDVLRQHYKVKFEASVWPEWLKTPETKRGLELDCYNEHLKIALEYDGPQHYVFPNRWHKTEKEFLNQVKRDRIKERLCRERGVWLIRVPYTVSKNKLREFILERIPPN